VKKCVGDDVMLAESRRWCKLLVNRVCRTLMLNTKPMLSEDAPMGVLNQGRCYCRYAKKCGLLYIVERKVRESCI